MEGGTLQPLDVASTGDNRELLLDGWYAGSGWETIARRRPRPRPGRPRPRPGTATLLTNELECMATGLSEGELRESWEPVCSTDVVCVLVLAAGGRELKLLVAALE